MWVKEKVKKTNDRDSTVLQDESKQITIMLLSRPIYCLDQKIFGRKALKSILHLYLKKNTKKCKMGQRRNKSEKSQFLMPKLQQQ